MFCTQFSFPQQISQLTVPSQWNLQEKTDTLECLHLAVTHTSTNIAKPSLTLQISWHMIYAIARQNHCNKGHSISNRKFCCFSLIIAMVHQKSPTVESCQEKIEGPLRRVNTEPSVDFRRANTEPSVDFRKANTEPS